ncbi:ABC transporter permease [Streptomyces sp. NPDC050617]|uniref:ABC transporter permease n=1 Tax=Streptomyces sp. NPDC050617 TaxID=3154628 RepID=UPI0034388B76
MSDTSLTWAARDASAMIGRQTTRLRHAPGLLAMTLTAPLLMLVLFGYLFGSAIDVPGGGDYREYLVPGLLVSVSTLGIFTGTLQAVQDRQRGVMDRFRTLPMSRSAVPVGQAVAEVLLAAVGLVPLALVGLAMGWRIRNGVGPALGAIGLLLLFRLATAWIGQYLGTVVKNEEAAGQLAALTFVLPMLSNTYVPTAGMPGWLRFLAEWNPISAVVGACRDLFGNTAASAAAAHPSWPAGHPVAASLLWSALLLAVFVPLTIRRYVRDGR